MGGPCVMVRENAVGMQTVYINTVTAEPIFFSSIFLHQSVSQSELFSVLQTHT